jgi:glycosyltransferase involved in cell wall biosynthesis/SAM-dependent methyltransferase
MKIAAVVITCNRMPLLPRALKSIAKQNRKPDFVFVVSNSTDEIFEAEKIICNDFGFALTKNLRTQTYTGALNSSVEEIIKHFGISDETYFASLDDDDEWLPNYLQEIENSNTDNFDLLIGNLLRKSETENELLNLPTQLSEKDFLNGNPGVCGSNTFIRLTTLLQAGCFDEGLPATADRDFFVRVFQQKPKHKVINRHFVNQYTDNDRPRETISGEKKKRSLQIFYYKYQHLMNEEEKEMFFSRAKNFFNISREEIETFKANIVKTAKQEIQFKDKGNYQFVIGFIAGNEIIAERIAKQIVERNIPVELVVIIDDTPKGKSLSETEKMFLDRNISHTIVKHKDWQANLASGHYGSYFKQFSEINSIPLGRTILHHHLFTETTEMQNPVYWIIDDDVSFSATTSENGNSKQVNLFEIINEHYSNADALIGSISNDPPVPTLCCIRGQLVDFLHSHNANNLLSADFLNLKSKPDYYYDLSDIHSDHLEIPIYHTSASESELEIIFSGKSLSRQALQKELKADAKTVTKRGANTLVFNRELLHYYPVINLEVNNKFARRGDLLWALLNQIVSNKKILEHTFSLDHNRPTTEFILKKELDKAGYDIIGYAFNKGIFEVINEIKQQTNPHRPKDIFEKLNQENFYQQFLKTYNYFLERRKTRFLMNYYRIIGLTKLLSDNFAKAKSFHSQVSDVKALNAFHSLLADAQDEQTLKSFFSELTTTIWTYSNSITDITEDDRKHQAAVEMFFGLKKHLRKLGSGAEGVAFTDENLVYKSYYNIPETDWIFLKEKSSCFSNHSLLEAIECFEKDENKFVRYSFHQFKPLHKVLPTEIVSFLKFCKTNEFVFTNINPKNCIQTLSGQMKLIDYGKSFEPFTEEKLLNATKRAYLLWIFPKMDNDSFQKLTARINVGEEPDEIKGWEKFWFAVSPRKKEEILDSEVVTIIKTFQPKRLLDYGSGKCKTARQIKTETQAEIFVYDVNRVVLENRCKGFPKYKPNDESFENSFDCALLNIVLCEVENSVAEEILSDISKALQQNGKLIVSVCNPDFAHIQKTEFQNRNFIPKNNAAEEVIMKTCIYTGKLKTEHHRPTGKYLELFSNFGFIAENIIDTKGVNLETIETASDFKIFMLRKV